ncbi:MAG: TIGR04282 family arsenosugar biosynthesis glycosyltransferase [Magnetococcales bacterium]|nr:TIGR04282 family arsenosugar biosynthesis glycosyltransferase [Magnetococcales bacterium]
MMNRKTHTILNIFGRTPQPGVVKTRLIPELGADGALRAHRTLLTHVFRNARTWQKVGKRRDGRRCIWLWGVPDAHNSLFVKMLPCGKRLRQPGGGLGPGLFRASQLSLRMANRIILLGGDAPSVDAGRLHEMECELEQSDAVLIPAEDGGFVALGLSCWHPALFRGICWGSTSVCDEVRKRFNRLGIRWRELAPLWDVDRPEDWQRYRRWISPTTPGVA